MRRVGPNPHHHHSPPADSTHWNVIAYGYTAFNGSGLATFSVAAQAIITTHIITSIDADNADSVLESIIKRALSEQGWDVSSQAIYVVCGWCESSCVMCAGCAGQAG